MGKINLQKKIFLNFLNIYMDSSNELNIVVFKILNIIAGTKISMDSNYAPNFVYSIFPPV